MSEEILYTTKDASIMLNMSEYTVRKKVREGELSPIDADSPKKYGYHFTKQELERYIKDHPIRSRSQFSTSNTVASAAIGAGTALLSKSLGFQAKSPTISTVISGALLGASLGVFTNLASQFFNTHSNEQPHIDEDDLDLQIGTLKLNIERQHKALKKSTNNKRQIQVQIKAMEIELLRLEELKESLSK